MKLLSCAWWLTLGDPQIDDCLKCQTATATPAEPGGLFGFASKRALAQQVLKQFERQIEEGRFAPADEPTFASPAAAYMRAGGDRTYVEKLLLHFGESPLRLIRQEEVDAAAQKLYPNGSPATRNRSVYTPVSAIMRHVSLSFEMKRPKGSQGNKATAWLTPDEAFRLFTEAKKIDPEFEALLIVLCYTGMRLSEALYITNVDLPKAFGYLPKTKNQDPRAVFLPKVVVQALANLPAREKSDRIFRFTKSGHLYSILRLAAVRAGVDLPQRQAFHLFRHTYATWMRREAGLDTKGLVATGAWKDRKSADRYEHVVVSEEAMKAELLPTPGEKIRGKSL